jgi:hypothetical protein
MSTTAQQLNLAKYDALLSLALAQVDAIEARDQSRLNRIIEQKWNVIRSLSGTKDLLDACPTLSSTIKRIQDADRLAEQKLATRMGEVQTNLVQMNRKSTARQVYSQTARKKHPMLGLAIDDTTPRYFDIHS